jgi:hypothetical protein
MSRTMVLIESDTLLGDHYNTEVRARRGAAGAWGA